MQREPESLDIEEVFMICSECGGDNDEDSRFCIHCGIHIVSSIDSTTLLLLPRYRHKQIGG